MSLKFVKCRTFRCICFNKGRVYNSTSTNSLYLFPDFVLITVQAQIPCRYLFPDFVLITVQAQIPCRYLFPDFVLITVQAQIPCRYLFPDFVLVLLNPALDKANTAKRRAFNEL